MFVKITNKDFLKEFTSIFDILKNYCEGLTLNFTNDNLQSQSMDSGNISLFELIIDKSLFSQYTVNNDVPVSLTMANFVKLLTSTNDKYKQLSLAYLENEDDCLQILFENYVIDESEPEPPKRRKRVKTTGYEDIAELTKTISKISIEPKIKITESIAFELPTIEYEYEIMGIPETETELSFIIDSKKLTDILNQLSIFDVDSITIIGSKKKNNIRFESSSVNCKKTSILLSNEMVESLTITKDINMSISAKYLKMCISNKITKQIKINITNETQPININYIFEHELIYFNFYIAPKVADDDE
jgi:DNA polymerase III sliding clamp (beta) subunit (PCNA family)